MSTAIRFPWHGVLAVARLGADRLWRFGDARLEAHLNDAHGADAHPDAAAQVASAAGRLAGEIVELAVETAIEAAVPAALLAAADAALAETDPTPTDPPTPADAGKAASDGA